MTSDAPGWDAIDARLGEFYPGVEPQHFGTLHRFALGGPDPLDGISFYARDEPVPHWHIIGYGMSELYAKETDNAEESGWGFEFTFRVARSPGESEPPIWAANLLQNLARYVFSSGNWFEPGHHMNANGPLRLDHPTEMTALAFTEDPELGTIDTPHGRLQFLQVVGLTGEEYTAVQQWDANGVLGLLAQRQSLLVTDLDRASITSDPAVRAAVEAGVAAAGSTPVWLLVDGFGWSREGGGVVLRFKGGTVDGLVRAIQDLLPAGRRLLLEGDGGKALLSAGPGLSAAEGDGGVLELSLGPEAVASLVAGLTPGRRVIAAGLAVEVS
ncbi:suppressor of fused domain protein [Actinoplanes sp. NPDC051861]|uniref:suppressor of fused domain protein n=1 Tax=Actinoplanes sp. NPDC051861 TaxID=3155170 RepID=UPI003414A6AD